MAAPIDLADNDLKILRVLQDDADLSMHQLAERIGLSHTPCWRRYNQLKEKGVIMRKVAVIDPELVGKGVTAICNISLSRHDEEHLMLFENTMRACPEVMECYAMSGDKDYTLRLAVSSIADCQRFIREKLVKVPGILSINTSFALKTVKMTTAIPI